MQRWMTPKEAAKVVPHSAWTIRRMLREGILPGKKICGLWAVDMKELNQLLGGSDGTN